MSTLRVENTTMHTDRNRDVRSMSALAVEDTMVPVRDEELLGQRKIP